jgi:hypothetical protein
MPTTRNNVQAEPVPMPAPAPVVPSAWTPQSIITYVASLAVFVIGLLTMSGVTIPGSVSSGIQLWSGVAVTLAGPAISLIAYLSHNSVTKAALAQGLTMHEAQRHG